MNKQKYLLIGAGLLGFLAVGLGIGYWYFVNTTTTIYKTPFGYIPDRIEVPQGTTVTFTNLTRQYMWPASDLHPTHDAYKEFDSRDPIAPYDSWSFTFERRGVWSYHDHLAAQLVGRIVVFDETGSTVFDCDGDDKKACWVADIEHALATGGVPAAYEALVRIHEKYPEFATPCHNYAHDIGLKAYVYYGRDVDFGPETSYCNAGFYHGFVEGLIDSNNDISVVEEFCDRTGERLKDSFPLAEQQCRHGIGHASLEYYINNNPELMETPVVLINKALDVCRSLNNEGDEKMRCASGVFNVYKDIVVVTNGFNVMEQGEEIYGVCASVEHEFEKEGCYREFSKLHSSGEYAGSILEALRDGVELDDPYVLDNFMVEEDKEVFLPRATMSWAMIMGKRAVSDHEVDTVMAVCEIVPSEVRAMCLRGITDGAFTSSAPFEEYLTVLPMCASDRLSAEEQEKCYSSFQRNIHDNYGPIDRRKQCVFIPDDRLDEHYCGKEALRV